MEEPITGIEKLIGFISRLLFTLVPSGMFLFFSYLFCHYYFAFFAYTIENYYVKLSPAWQILLPLCAVFSLSLVIESVARILFYNIMDFGDLAQFSMFGVENNQDLKEKKAKIFNKTFDGGESKTIIKTYLTRSYYSMSVVISSVENPRIFNYIYYQLGREYATNNLTIVILLITNLYFPYVVSRFGDGNGENLIWFQILQTILSGLSIFLCYLLICLYFKWEYSDNNKNYKLIFKLSFVIPIILGMILFAFALQYKLNWLIFLSVNILSFPVLIGILYKGLHEYRQVEKYYYAYLVYKLLKKNDNVDS